MGNGSREGVYARKASILVYFQYEGESCLERLDLPPTPKNLAYAADQRREILRRIELGTFRFEDFFPNSPRVAKTSSKSFGVVKADWLASKARKIAETTYTEYRNTLNYFAEIDDELIANLDFQRLDKLMSDLDVSGKTFNNVLSVLRQVFDYAVKIKLCTHNPAREIEGAPKKEAAPDPLTQDEAVAIINDLYAHYPHGIARYFALGFAIGFRPSEGIALKWSNVDWRQQTLTIDSARVRSRDKGTKTGKIRHVELDEYCIDLLKAQKAESFMKDGYIFLNPNTGEQHKDTSDMVRQYWKPALRRLGIRERDARQVRHSCATIMLTEGCRPAWAASQLGHSLEMFFKVYAKWISGQDKGREREKISGVFKKVAV